MTAPEAKPFDIWTAPLTGTHLIEASAGTGKTYTLEGLFVRLILERRLPIDQILVVTFTNNAVEELKNRIRKKLILSRDHLNRLPVDDPFVKSLHFSSADAPSAVDLITNALIDFDRAAICTIHGFCQKIIQEQAFETQSDFSSNILPDPDAYLEDIANDYWRMNIYQTPIEIVTYAVKKLAGPVYFKQLYDRFHHPGVKVIPETIALNVPQTLGFQTCYRKVRQEWGTQKAVILKLLEDPALDGRKYGSPKTMDKQLGLTKRTLKLRQIEKEVDLLLAPEHGRTPLIEIMEWLSWTKILNCTLTNKTSPTHDFFHLCDEFLMEAKNLCLDLDQYLLALSRHFFSFAHEQLELKKRINHELGFDDLLVLVRDALKSENGPALLSALRKRHGVALVDEFQDTDAIQYDIFNILFSTKDHSLFMIGDPKQAIYGFRGADIFSYLKAVDQSKEAHTLMDNWRSTPELITAVNTIFSRQDPAFLFDKIPFHPVRPGRPVDPDKTEPGSGLVLWHLFEPTETREEKPLTVEQATETIANAVADEILSLSTRVPDPVLPKDIAVLVRTNRQAGTILRHLFKRNIAAVLFHSGNIFDTDEALELQRILWGLADPGNERKMKAALSTEMLGGKGCDFQDADSNEFWERRVTRLRRYAALWKNQGFMPMFRCLLTEENIKQRLMGFPDGERRVTNLLHLGELIHHADMEQSPGVLGLVKWLSQRRMSKMLESEEHLLRLEKDAHAVRIITIHKSKGLEYPVVFCPFGWEHSLVQNTPAVQYHDPDRDDDLVVDLGTKDFQTHKILAQREKLAENIRLLYVALTRARQKCYLTWGPIKGAETSAPAYLFHFETQDPSIAHPDVVTALKDIMANKTHDQLLADLRLISEQSHGTIVLTQIPLHKGMPVIQNPKPEDGFSFRSFAGHIDETWKVTSYSNLTGTVKTSPEARDRDTWSPFLSYGYDLNDREEQPILNYAQIHHFPKGTRSGIFFHDLFEHLDFHSSDEAHRYGVVAGKLKEYGYPSDWQPAVLRMLENILSAPLIAGKPDLTLSAISLENRINEMEFYYPIQWSNPSGVMEILDFREGTELTDREEKFVFSPIQGFMRGFVDMAFAHDGKYYILDWKSNFLGNSPEHYSQHHLLKAMQDHQYHVQYLIYTLALHQYLSKRIPNYDYRTHVGGVFYLFIRGINPQYGPGAGIFYDLPDFQKIQTLANTLIP